MTKEIRKLNKLLVATHNPGKFKIIKDKLSSLNIEILSLDDLGIKEDFEETGQTYQENASGKAKFYYKLAQMPTLGDDSGLSVDALDGAPGLYSRFWPGYKGTDEELLKMLLDKLKDVPDAQRTAKFVTVLALFDGQQIYFGQGEVKGVITQEALCDLEPGLPYSAVFRPDGYDKVFSQLTLEEKRGVSHRAKAVDEIIKQLSARGGVNK
ncbi:MAG: hypothetical protein A2406_02390 [Candidatus Komeilibacteria bacterium RIFOXYC1_FULL_37_11]|uniref:dITP/XTP pyrophosphatase n=1 Tax=Candidatus Komeilibacteria bacterium RIFOXYC1_FULL_37_11 TaxID=1798555 RepID=A0A1G2BZX1_9BACT|nr:MAG: hypothetical protein A2406_02390 [Candidatus Komeilibacteria bacterium RIFOXYC1_FULL_37_11]OGY95593.1 MAG: hypothetical protein A2611_02235 [Candidatus Komeilibacteria bacterium RIFOXYD1_FULL_37_29]OGY97191.1 MAG: hypothetical protein A2543_00455 [Candidatus Komeilibacteria bacterium RIFOXYD2_FULL_37_8]